MSKGIDVNQNVTDYAGLIKRAGIDFVGRYLPFTTKKDPLTRAEALHLSDQGLHIVSIYENSTPTHDGYFKLYQANLDVSRAHVAINNLGQPNTSPVYFAVDYDAKPDGVMAYFKVLHDSEFHKLGYPIGVYGSGAVCKALLEAGYVTHTWLSQSDAHTGTTEFAKSNRWNIHQREEVTNWHGTGLDVDLNISQGNGGGWQLVLASV